VLNEQKENEKKQTRNLELQKGGLSTVLESEEITSLGGAESMSAH
jgi:hypothetical protein